MPVGGNQKPHFICAKKMKKKMQKKKLITNIDVKEIGTNGEGAALGRFPTVRECGQGSNLATAHHDTWYKWSKQISMMDIESYYWNISAEANGVLIRRYS